MEKIPFYRKVAASVLYMLIAAGGIFFFDAFRDFTSKKAGWMLWIIIFGIGMAYSNDYKFEISLRKFQKRLSK